MARIMSPDDYRAQSGFRRSAATAIPPSMVNRTGPVSAWTSMDLDSPVLAEFLRDGRVSSAGVSISEHGALRNSVFFRAVNLIAGSIGMLPTHLMRRTVNGKGKETIEKAKDHPLYRVLLKRPNSYQTAFEFKSYMQTLALLEGNAYALIVRGLGGRAAQLIPLPRRTVTPKLSDDWQLTFEYRRPKGGTIVLQPDQVFHFRHPITRDGLKGVDLIDMAVNALGISTQAERAAGKLLNGGVMAGGSLETSQSLGDDAIDQLKKSLAEDYSSADNAGNWLVLEEGLTAKPFLASAKDAQYDELRKRQGEEIARFTGAPRPLLMLDETNWGTGVEVLGQFFVTYGLGMWFVAWEQAIERSCFTVAEQNADELYVKFNDGALLRGSLKDQADFFKAALGPNNAYRTPNEVRGAFDMNPIDGGDELPKPSAALAPKEPANG